MRLNFRDSPFYTIVEPLTQVWDFKGNSSPVAPLLRRTHLSGSNIDQRNSVRESTRDQLEFKINLRQETVDRLTGDSTLKVMVYCASDPISPYTKVDIAFPHQVEIRVNMDEVKANLRGLKNKPGSTRPADITNLVRKRAGYANSLSVTYALTNKVSLVRQWEIPTLFLVRFRLLTATFRGSISL